MSSTSSPPNSARSCVLVNSATLGRGHVNVSVRLTVTRIDDSKGAWNHTMSHPTADQHLGRFFSFPRIAARVGVSDRVDVGAWGGLAPHGNYGLVGVDTKIALLRQRSTAVAAGAGVLGELAALLPVRPAGPCRGHR